MKKIAWYLIKWQTSQTPEGPFNSQLEALQQLEIDPVTKKPISLGLAYPVEIDTENNKIPNIGIPAERIPRHRTDIKLRSI